MRVGGATIGVSLTRALTSLLAFLAAFSSGLPGLLLLSSLILASAFVPAASVIALVATLASTLERLMVRL